MAEKFDKKNLVEKISEEQNMTKKQATEIVDSIFGEIKQQVKMQNDVFIFGFGTFCAVQKPERTGRNPKNGEDLVIKSHISPKFKAAKGYKDFLND